MRKGKTFAVPIKTAIMDAMTRFQAYVAICLAIIALGIADEVRVYFSLNRQFPKVIIGTITVPCGDHIYGRRIQIMSEGKMQAFYGCYDWSNDRWTLSPIPGSAY